MKLLAEKVFEPLRKWYGKLIQVTSFFRSAKINKAVGGVQKGNSVSQHTTGQAADINTVSDNKKLFDYIKDNLIFDQLIWEYGNDSAPDWVHVRAPFGQSFGYHLPLPGSSRVVQILFSG